MLILTRGFACAVTLFLLAGCASNNPYDSQATGVSGKRTATYGGLAALAGAAVGAAVSHDDRGKGAAIGAVLAGAAGAGYGYYADRQEAELRRSMQGTGVEVQRQGDDIKLIMPGNITFATDSAEITPSFYAPLNNLASSFKQFQGNSIEIVGYTDSTGSRQHNMALAQRRAQSVSGYLLAQGIDAARLSSRGAGPDQPIADNASAEGRAQNRRVEVSLKPLPGQAVQ
jgi:outer membrane protein OmpA-like peptidoglycan-associated protein